MGGTACGCCAQVSQVPSSSETRRRLSLNRAASLAFRPGTELGIIVAGFGRGPGSLALKFGGNILSEHGGCKDHSQSYACENQPTGRLRHTKLIHIYLPIAWQCEFSSRQDRTRVPTPLAVCNRSGNANYGRRNRLPPPFRNREILPLLVKAKRTGKVPQKFSIRPKNA